MREQKGKGPGLYIPLGGSDVKQLGRAPFFKVGDVERSFGIVMIRFKIVVYHASLM